MITAKVICASYNPYTKSTAYTFEIEYPRFIHSELMTHRMLSKNSASSRAIPVPKMLENIKNNTAEPIHWGKNQSGMQAFEELTGDELSAAKWHWQEGRDKAIEVAMKLHAAGVHKQITNRITEPYSHMKVVITGTERENFYWLRRHKDAQPEIHELADKMYEVEKAFEPMTLRIGEWHLPYIKRTRVGMNNTIVYSIPDIDGNDVQIPLEQAKMLSASLCAQVSYRLANFNLDKAEDIYKRLIESEPVHASPVEHQLKCISDAYGAIPNSWPEGITHMTRDGQMWSGNIRGFIQMRQLIPNHTMKG